MIITLLSDWGTKDATAALAKATLMRYVPDAEVVDISHHVARQSQRQAAYVLASFYKTFPKGTVHLSPVSVFVGKVPCMIVVEYEGYYFIAPDNGLLPLALGDATGYTTRLARSYPTPYNFAAWLQDAGYIAQAIAKGGVLPGAGFIPQTLRQMPPAQLTHVGIECQVLFTDRYGNVVLNITREEFDNLTANKPFSIQTMKGNDITSISNHYSDVAKEMPLCRFNKAGLLEVAVNHGSATEMLGFEQEDIAHLRYNPVRIFV